ATEVRILPCAPGFQVEALSGRKRKRGSPRGFYAIGGSGAATEVPTLSSPKGMGLKIARVADGTAKEILRCARDLCGTRPADLGDDRRSPDPGVEFAVGFTERAYHVAAGDAGDPGNVCAADAVASLGSANASRARRQREFRAGVAQK